MPSLLNLNPHIQVEHGILNYAIFSQRFFGIPLTFFAKYWIFTHLIKSFLKLTRINN